MQYSVSTNIQTPIRYMGSLIQTGWANGMIITNALYVLQATNKAQRR